MTYLNFKKPVENTVKKLEMMPGHKYQARVLAITSGKGGVGKTNIAANLAICLSELRKKVLLFDADLSLGNLDIVMNIHSKYNISHIMKGQKTIEEIIQAGPTNTEIICGASGLENIANINEFQRQRLLSELAKLQFNNDVIIIDTAAGISKPVVGFCLAADHTFVVTTPEATAITDAYAMIKVLTKNHYNGQISLIVNMADSISQGRKTYQQISGVAKRFLNANIYNAGVILRDEQLVSAIRQRKPVVLAYPRAGISLFLTTLATRLSKCSYAPQSESFLRKVVDWFL